MNEDDFLNDEKTTTDNMNNKIRGEIGKYFLDVSKLLFGGVVLASIIRMEDVSKV